MPKTKLTFKKSKKVLRKRCKTLTTELGKASKIFKDGVTSNAVKGFTKKVASETEAAVGNTAVVSYEVDLSVQNVGLLMFCAQTHGCLISEWHSFLNRVFGELADCCLTKGDSDLVTKNLEVSLKGADFSTKTKLRESIKEVLCEKFSSKGHQERLGKLRKILKINNECTDQTKLDNINALTKTIIKHIVVRNCLEHADCKVRERDLRYAGYGDKIPMLNTDSSTREFSEGEEIFVSQNDISELEKAILDYMNYFEVEL